MDLQLRHKILYIILASIMLYTLYLINFRNNILTHPISAAITSFSFFSVITIIIISLYPELLDPNRSLSKIDDYVVFIATSTFLIVSISLISGYGTDDMEYIFQALNYLFSGKNPYLANYYPYSVGPTYLINGKIASTFVYPPFSFLVYIPFYLLIRLTSAPGYYINIVNVIFDVILIILIYLEGRKKQDPLAVLSVIFLYLLTAIAIPPFYGVNSVIPATFLLISYLRDDKWGGISLGIASSFIQLSWLALPFILIYKLKNSKINKIKNYLLYFILTIIIINLPFVILNYKAFLYNIFTTDINTIPVGALGLTVINYAGVYQLEPWFFTFSESVVSIFLIYIYYRFFEILKQSIWIYPMIISWFMWRTLTEYFFLWIPLLFVTIYKMDYKLPSIKINIRKDIGVPLFILLTLLLSVGVYAHETYISTNPLKILNVQPLGKQPYSAILVEVKNLGNKPLNITLVRVSLPNNLNMVWNFTYTLIPPNSSSILFAYAPYYNETINSTVFTVEVYSYYYFATYKVNVSNIS
ncbi:hypothetical protein [Sulfurisphaera tokodaii]|uniref:Uncharacterized protein n=1 Tax=Sulfurisphaera tokodaii (strain DSM 16993 / JCM 10545 / NBRC 100140 / 7) TaxID=273063 RepID=Q96YL6_SULTO|nr:hypothetical protein [Sulfurisphaera tokodaii]BAB67261.1 hypothetical protein STK_21580 [Sulfurisphaera tokodaii str. 7]